MNPAPPIGELILLAYHWQTLITGIFATIAAFATVAAIRQQVDSESNASREERSRRAKSHRDVLPMVLSNLCAHLRHDSNRLRSQLSGPSANACRMPELPGPLLQASDIETIRNVIEFEGVNNTNVEQLSILLAKVQIYQSRRRGGGTHEITNRHDIIGLCVDCIDLYASASKLFNYARPQRFNMLLDDDDGIRNAATNLGYHDIGPDCDVLERMRDRMEGKNPHTP